jgi:NADP-reducing hydrogenase subunit HndB
MNKIQSLDDLIRLKEEVQARWGTGEDGDSSDSLVQIKVGMATCGIASGARDEFQGGRN